ncbi:threonine/serine exporter family protein [Cloacibacillus sp. An23]|uniref:threonine/serine exporter family protein n=1 Tax=Cloacibacillus sp. An23 TaxID=1965591 RepID=UPI000B383FCD|nr:threonine/serine exporter family protein [Cloacibacillus sp. An23]OUO95209.1 hypothetical protein B5F39_01380 [Cloacibacillus sp. An23]
MQAQIIQTIMGMIASACFAVLFGVRDRKLAWIAAGSGAGWAVYLVCVGLGHGMYWGLFWASLFVSALSEVLARVVRTPVILLLVPMLIPEFPGKDLYYTMYHFVRNNYDEFAETSNMVLLEAGAIATGIILASCAAKLAWSITAHVSHRNNGRCG